MSKVRSPKVAKILSLTKAGKTPAEIAETTGFNDKTIRNTIVYHLHNNKYNKNNNMTKATTTKRAYVRKNVVVLDVVRVNRKLAKVRAELTNLHASKVKELKDLTKQLKRLTA